MAAIKSNRSKRKVKNRAKVKRTTAKLKKKRHKKTIRRGMRAN